jgi:hypothetical protein
VKLPAIAAGAGSLIDFKLSLGRTSTFKGKKAGLLEAKCPDGKFKVTTPRILFKNEAKIPNVPATTTLKGSLFVPCTPKG